MNNENVEIIKRLNFENLIWICFIIISVLDIYGDELIKKSILSSDKKCRKTADKIFLGITLFSLLIYIYFLMRNYNDCKVHNDNDSYQVRLIGSIFIITGTICFLYFQLTTSFTDSPSNV